MNTGDVDQVQILEVDDDGAPLPPPSDASEEVSSGRPARRRLPFNPWLLAIWLAVIAGLICLVLGIRAGGMGYGSWGGSLMRTENTGQPDSVENPQWWMYLVGYVDNLLVAVVALITLALTIHAWSGRKYRFIWIVLIWAVFACLIAVSIGSLFASPQMPAQLVPNTANVVLVDILNGLIIASPSLHHAVTLASIFPLVAGFAIPAALWQRRRI